MSQLIGCVEKRHGEYVWGYDTISSTLRRSTLEDWEAASRYLIVFFLLPLSNKRSSANDFGIGV